MKTLSAALMLALTAPAGAATLTEIGGFDPHGPSLTIDAGDFTRVGACGGGASVVAGGCAVVVNGSDTKWGRYAGEADSQDANQIWNVSLPKPRSTIQFSVSDMMDMPWSTGFRITGAADAVWEESQRQQSGTVRYFELVLDKATAQVAVLFEHLGIQPGKAFSGDGFGVGVCHRGRHG